MTETTDMGEVVRAAAQGSQQAWDVLVDRYMPLVISVARGFRLSSKDVEDISQTVWLRLVEHIDSLREPRALPGWIVTTARREAIRVQRSKLQTNPVDPGAGGPLDRDADSVGMDDRLLTAERHRALRGGLRELPVLHRQLIELMVIDPPLSYQEISARLAIPVGSIGPTRKRALAKLRATGPIQSLLGAESERR
ncbi:RNA polymerase sigma factor [Nakamurella multipartita]|jgi:RNA polymerase sigma factor (sigma-70 family)|uniref:RNA polymerase, sigma-24 subunit, ECF subfamily n=1 Tax=Nakamurella multipartita (strain ATCC 700099 / DSM 44233 / CIP 104796 / JCM 9543 / NBRC 105858 / Y-104) TaxID=479431 RepID=C8XD96_NAKMY|nr:sigma-70 family RNA polymerase sigma factor [Nakamurella multipartita]ACV81586.1 RNA polymerase, sigma-24 subunit, ECF subfamily [Nakamurella multipartita DSM 44233]HOZ58208.1 sigma-70 family RNA polymerase sigma factor [Nakamurella multipartita]